MILVDERIRERKSELLRAAYDAAMEAYCPYSNFRVGAAVFADGQVFTGFNIENASLGLTVCAERVAIFKAISSGVKIISAIAIACPNVPSSAPNNTNMPCGACRQVMSEFASADFVAFVDKVGDFDIGQLLPSPFMMWSGS